MTTDPNAKAYAKPEAKVIDLAVDLPAADVLRMMGYRKGPGARPPDRDFIQRLIAQAKPLIAPRAAYVIRDVENMTDTQLTLRASPTFRGPVAGFLRPSRRVAVYVLTIGPELERLAQQRMADRRILEGFALDAVGSAAADITADALAHHFRNHELAPDEALTPPFSPGYCGLPLDSQRTLFAIVDAAPIGVTLTESCFMQPVKSISGLIGIGPQQDVAAHGVPCQYCDLQDCKMRRT